MINSQGPSLRDERQGGRAACMTGVALGLLALGAATGAMAAEPTNAGQDGSNAPYGNGQIQSWHIQGNVWLMAGEPGNSNVVVQVGPDGAIVVDSGVQSAAGDLLERINQLARSQPLLDPSAKPLHLVIDTSAAADHVGGNAVLREGGGTLLAGNAAFDVSFNPGAEVWANENVQLRMLTPGADGQPAVPQPLWPTQTRSEDLYSLMYNGEPVQLIHPHAAISNGDTMVLFRNSNVLVTGNVLDMDSYPIIDTQHGGTIDGELVALNRVLDLAVPGSYEEGGTLIVPGHGHICDQGVAVSYRNTLTQIRDRIQYYKNQGKSLQQVLALKPSYDSDSRYASSAESAEQFVRAVYDTLPAKGPMFSMHTEYVVPAASGASARREVF
jgi:glyoxylase-like metal-dependent hydrolase (beta-lactamase superfamily II)